MFRIGRYIISLRNAEGPGARIRSLRKTGAGFCLIHRDGLKNSIEMFLGHYGSIQLVWKAIFLVVYEMAPTAKWPPPPPLEPVNPTTWEMNHWQLSLWLVVSIMICESFCSLMYSKNFWQFYQANGSKNSFIRFSCDRCAACFSDAVDGGMELYLVEPKLAEEHISRPYSFCKVEDFFVVWTRQPVCC